MVKHAFQHYNHHSISRLPRVPSRLFWAATVAGFTGMSTCAGASTANEFSRSKAGSA